MNSAPGSSPAAGLASDHISERTIAYSRGGRSEGRDHGHRRSARPSSILNLSCCRLLAILTKGVNLLVWRISSSSLPTSPPLKPAPTTKDRDCAEVNGRLRTIKPWESKVYTACTGWKLGFLTVTLSDPTRCCIRDCGGFREAALHFALHLCSRQGMNASSPSALAASHRLATRRQHCGARRARGPVSE